MRVLEAKELLWISGGYDSVDPITVEPPVDDGGDDPWGDDNGGGWEWDDPLDNGNNWSDPPDNGGPVNQVDPVIVTAYNPNPAIWRFAGLQGGALVYVGNSTTIGPNDSLTVEAIVVTAASTTEHKTDVKIQIKPTANVANISSHISDIYDEIEDIWGANGMPNPWITSGNDSRHSAASLHYKNLAIDLRANNMTKAEGQDLANQLQAELGPDYDVVYEPWDSNPQNRHIHVEYDPK